ncbi:MAG: hypothetical protein QM727_02405 [Niabella sp.]
MQRNLLFYFMLLLCLSVTSCGLNEKRYPERVFEKIALNGNKILGSFKQHFKEIRAQLKGGNLVIVTPKNEVKEVSASEYIENHYSHMFDGDIKAIKELKPKEETAQILKKGLDMFQYADEIYKNDFPRIAKMIDEGKSDEEIDTAIENLDLTKGVALDEKRESVMNAIIPYADKHGVDYKVMKMPKFPK